MLIPYINHWPYTYQNKWSRKIYVQKQQRKHYVKHFGIYIGTFEQLHRTNLESEASI